MEEDEKKRVHAVATAAAAAEEKEGRDGGGKEGLDRHQACPRRWRWEIENIALNLISI